MVPSLGVRERVSFDVFAGESDRVLAAFEEGLEAAFEEGLEGLSRAVAQAAAVEDTWVGRVRRGLVALLGFFEDEPERGRLLIAAQRTGDEAGFRDERRLLGVLSGLLDDGAPQALGELMPDPQLTSELISGGVFSVLRACMLEGEEGQAQPLVELTPELMAFIVRPYLGQAAASAELTPGGCQ